MASAYLKTTKSGERFYEMHARRGKEQFTKRWPIPDGLSEKTIDNRLRKALADFERDVKAGKVLTRKQAKEAARQAAEAAAQIQTLKQYGERVFMPALTVTCSENTRSSYQGQLDNHIYPALGSFKLPEITAAQINAYLLQQQADGLSIASVEKQFKVLSQLFKMAYNEDMIDKNPMDKVKKPKAKKDEMKKEIEAYTEEELKRILDCVKNEPLKVQVMLNLFAFTGARRGEVMGLKWSDIDKAAGVIHIRRTMCYTSKKGTYSNPPKNGKERSVPVPEPIFAMLDKLKKEQIEAGKVITLDPSLVGFVFRQEGINAPMHPQTPTRLFQSLGKRYGIKDFHPHKMRHTFASVLISNGFSVAAVAEILGHTDKAVTLRMYTHADEESKRRASEAMWNIVKAKASGQE